MGKYKNKCMGNIVIYGGKYRNVGEIQKCMGNTEMYWKNSNVWITIEIYWKYSNLRKYTVMYGKYSNV